MRNKEKMVIMRSPPTPSSLITTIITVITITAITKSIIITIIIKKIIIMIIINPKL